LFDWISELDLEPLFVSMVFLGFVLLWYALVYVQKSRIVSKYEQDPILANSSSVRAGRLFRYFGPFVRSAYYSMHLAFILATPDVLLGLYPGYRDLRPRRAILSKFSASDLVLATASTAISISLIIFVLVHG